MQNSLLEVFSIPTALAKSSEYEALSDVARSEFLSRLKYIIEIVEKIESIQVTTLEELHYALDDLELDCIVNLSVSADRERLSPWLLHSSWTFECKTKVLYSSLGMAIEQLDAPVPSLCSTSSEFVDWLKLRAQILKNQLRNLVNASDFCTAVAVLISIDLILASLILALTKARLNANLHDR